MSIICSAWGNAFDMQPLYLFLCVSVSKSAYPPGRVNTRPPPALLRYVILLHICNTEDQAPERLNRCWKGRHEKMRIKYVVDGIKKGIV